MNAKFKRTGKILKIMTVSLILTVIAAIPCVAFSENRFVPYKTYSYDYNGNQVVTPHAYLPNEMLSGADMGAGDFSFPTDIEYSGGFIYISDTGNDRIVKLNEDFKPVKIIDSFKTPGGEDKFKSPQGLFVRDDELYVADTGNGRVVKLSAQGEFLQIFGAPEAAMLGDDFRYEPKALVADSLGNLFVVAHGVNMGVIRFNAKGDFVSFFGAQEASYSAIDLFWKRFMTEEQRLRMQDFIPMEYNNISIDKNGFIFVTTSDLDTSRLVSAIYSRSSASRSAPVRRLNPAGKDVLERSGYFPPAGDVIFGKDESGNPEVSVIADIALHESGAYTLMDTRYNILFTYSATGALLYAFSGTGGAAGNTISPSAVVYKGTDLLVLDKNSAVLTIFRQTEYGARINQALELYNNFKYDESVESWNEILKMNANFDLAFDGIGDAHLRRGQYEEALKYFTYSNNRAAYSEAFKGYRDHAARSYLWIIIPLALLLIFGAWRLLSYIAKRNKSPEYKDKRQKFSGQFLYGFYILYHPFDGFYDMKHERRGSVRGAGVWMLTGAGAIVISKVFTSFLFNSAFAADINFLWEFLTVLIPLGLWIVSNWCFTTLMNGEGRLKDIFTFAGYAMLPIAILFIISTPVSYLLTASEGMYLELLRRAGILWFVFLMFCGNIVIHQYTAIKSAVSAILSMLGIAIIIFVSLLLATSYQKAAALIVNLYQELISR